MKINTWRRFPSDPSDWFSAEEIAKAKQYVRPLGRLSFAERAVALAADLVLVSTHAAPRLLDALEIRRWPLRLLVTVLLLQLVGTLAVAGFSAYRELVYDKRWGFSTQTVGGFGMDAMKNTVLGVVLFSLLLLPLWAIIRATSLWWIYGWLLMGVFVVGLGLLAPVLIMPLFNKFSPLEDDDLREDLLGVARSVDADVNEIEVSDASRRTRKDNAFVTGLGKTRKLVVYDNLLTRPREQVRSVAAHEIGHWKLGHIRRVIPLVAGLLLANFALLKLVLEWDTALDWAGVGSVRDPAILPLFMVVFTAASALTGLVSAWVTRAGEREADLFALETTRDPTASAEMLRALHTDNLSDLAPSRWKMLTATHPPVAERLALNAAWAEAEAEGGGCGGGDVGQDGDRAERDGNPVVGSTGP